jgi:hypothetical protein
MRRPLYDTGPRCYTWIMTRVATARIDKTSFSTASLLQPSDEADVDLWIAVHRTNAGRVVAALREFGFAVGTVPSSVADRPPRRAAHHNRDRHNNLRRRSWGMLCESGGRHARRRPRASDQPRRSEAQQTSLRSSPGPRRLGAPSMRWCTGAGPQWTT